MRFCCRCISYQMFLQDILQRSEFAGIQNLCALFKINLTCSLFFSFVFLNSKPMIISLDSKSTDIRTLPFPGNLDCHSTNILLIINVLILLKILYPSSTHIKFYFVKQFVSRYYMQVSRHNTPIICTHG